MTTKEKEMIVFLLIVFLVFNAMGIVYLGVFSIPYIKKDLVAVFNTASGENNQVIEIREGEDVLDPEIGAPISDYFKISFEAIANLQTTDITTLFLDPSSENAWLNQSALDYLIKLRLKQGNDLTISNYECGLAISEISQEGEDVEIVVIEDNTVNFAFTSDVDSSSSGIRHIFKLRKAGNAYVIVEHYKDEDSFIMLQEAIGVGSDNSAAVLDTIYRNASSAVEALSLEKQTYNSGEAIIRMNYSEKKYDAEAAVGYAMAWVDPKETVRNVTRFGIYDEVGGNCNNYISQCLNAGGIPMDYIGDVNTQWKWYSDDVNLDESDSGRSPAWAGVEEFYIYARENSGYGLKAVVDDNVFSGSVGDVLQYGHDGKWVHSVIITKVIKDKNGKVLDYLINSNTTDRMNYPASAYGYSELRLIKIIGWNEN